MAVKINLCAFPARPALFRTAALGRPRFSSSMAAAAEAEVSADYRGRFTSLLNNTNEQEKNEGLISLYRQWSQLPSARIGTAELCPMLTAAILLKQLDAVGAIHAHLERLHFHQYSPEQVEAMARLFEEYGQFEALESFMSSLPAQKIPYTAVLLNTYLSTALHHLEEQIPKGVIGDTEVSFEDGDSEKGSSVFPAARHSSATAMRSDAQWRSLWMKSHETISRILTLFQRHSIEPDSSTLVMVAGHYVTTRNFAAAERLILTLKPIGDGKTNTDLCNYLLYSYVVEERCFREAVEFLRKMLESKAAAANETTFDMLIGTLADEYDLEKVEAVMGIMRANSLQDSYTLREDSLKNLVKASVKHLTPGKSGSYLAKLRALYNRVPVELYQYVFEALLEAPAIAHSSFSAAYAEVQSAVRSPSAPADVGAKDAEAARFEKLKSFIVTLNTTYNLPFDQDMRAAVLNVSCKYLPPDTFLDFVDSKC